MAALRVRPPVLDLRLLSTGAVENLRKNQISSATSFQRRRRKEVHYLTSSCNRRVRIGLREVRGSATETQFQSAEVVVDAANAGDVVFTETFPLKRSVKVEGKIIVQVDKLKKNEDWKVSVTCDLPGTWVLHWGVTYNDQFDREWDQPPMEMRPDGSVPVKDYAIETPLRRHSSSEGQLLCKVDINVKSTWSIGAIHFVLKDEDTGAWYQHKGRDFRLHFHGAGQDNKGSIDDTKGFKIWPAFDRMSSMLLQTKDPQQAEGKGKEAAEMSKGNNGYSEQYPIIKETFVDNILAVTVRENKETDRYIVFFDTNLVGDVIIHWGVCSDAEKRWEIPLAPYPPKTNMFRSKALQTLLEPKENDSGSCGIFSVDRKFIGMLFVLKVDERTWLNDKGKDFYIPLRSKNDQLSQLLAVVAGSEVKGVGSTIGVNPLSDAQIVDQLPDDTLEASAATETEESRSGAPKEGSESDNEYQSVNVAEYADGIINEIRNLVSDISSEKSVKVKRKGVHENILQEIEKLAAEAYSIFRGYRPDFPEESVSVADPEAPEPSIKVSSGTGSGYEILCQGFNWESHKSGKWYLELYDQAAELASLGFTVIWLPPPTDSVSPEGYMPKDLYNLQSRYGNMEELKSLVKRFHDVGIRVLGDVVLNHRCAQYQNQNGIWNIFGGRLNWDDRAIVADDPHFQGRGNKSSGDNFHAAPNIDHSQEFVRNDLKEWLLWLRKEIGYDGWRLDFVRGFWGGYVKDYLTSSEPYFAVGEYWDSLSYTYGKMDHNQDAHRQRIIDWINATGGTAGAFDVTTKGILHAALENCEYWRLCDQKGKPPGVVGWWPSRAVTFIENHDTGSTQGHWRFPAGKEMQGYAYILTHPGTPTVFYDHLFSHYKGEIAELMALRNRFQINCRSTIQITKAERDVYAAIIDDKVSVKIGPGYYEPPSGSKKWVICRQGKDYQVWEAA